MIALAKTFPARHRHSQPNRSTRWSKKRKNKAQEIASAAGEKFEQLTAGAGKGLESIAEGIRKYSPDEDRGGAAFNKVADTLKTSGQYLEEHGVSDITEDLTKLIRNNPVPALLVAMGIGFILARATARS